MGIELFGTAAVTEHYAQVVLTRWVDGHRHGSMSGFFPRDIGDWFIAELRGRGVLIEVVTFDPGRDLDDSDKRVERSRKVETRVPKRLKHDDERQYILAWAEDQDGDDIGFVGEVN